MSETFDFSGDFRGAIAVASPSDNTALTKLVSQLSEALQQDP